MSEEPTNVTEKRFQVFNGKEKVHESQRKDSALKKIRDLKTNNTPLIVFKDTKQNRTVTYTKSRNSQNYVVK